MDNPERPGLPDVCWVKFPAVRNAGSMRVAFESIAAQLAKQPVLREVRDVLVDDDTIRLVLEKEEPPEAKEGTVNERQHRH
ncbi:hypothetical protein SAMN05421543_1646 [Alicyclobacillus macrosporangiidus]|uniref:Uncharacterized protein n=1 Tax=Alicyclobacillus macrosporangiidus TaxID=392015 RepID=A0A1I7LJ57_9BACL|nr:hypothetical protein SAMN05421543_1646 [Alicyclobacillus macrosporangiidus]